MTFEAVPAANCFASFEYAAVSSGLRYIFLKVKSVGLVRLITSCAPNCNEPVVPRVTNTIVDKIQILAKPIAFFLILKIKLETEMKLIGR